MDIENLIGKNIGRVLIIESYDEVRIECKDSEYRMYHMQDCCEEVVVYDVKGNKRLSGKVIEAYEHNDDRCDEYGYKSGESYTWTTYFIKTDRGDSLEIVWLGESNGYYSESVYFELTHKSIEL